jgi:hypothetical protein
MEAKEFCLTNKLITISQYTSITGLLVDKQRGQEIFPNLYLLYNYVFFIIKYILNSFFP